MNAKTDRWEVYTDRAGKRHWRWPATSVPSEGDDRDVAVEPRQGAGSRAPQRATFVPLPPRGR